MMIGKKMAAALTAATAALALLFQPGSAAADEVTITKNGTPLLLAPKRNAPTGWKVNSGFPLTVLEERDGWMRVQSAQLPEEGGELWVRSNQVSGGAGAAAGAFEQPIGYRIELTGTPDMKFKMECRIVREDGSVSFRPHFNRLPQTYEFSTDPLACFAWKKEPDGVLELTLVEVYPTKERIIGSAATQDYGYAASIVARTRGPDHPTEIFTRSGTPWGPEVVTLATRGSLYLTPSGIPF